MRFFVALVLFFLLPFWAFAQDATRDRDFLTALIEDSFSDQDRVVQISGFKGALSSRAQLDELTISDKDGVWFTLRGALLDWDRAALLSGRLVVQQLTAKEILFPRLPRSNTTLPAAKARGFSLPDLPISLEIGDISVSRIVLGEELFGESAEVSMSGSGSLISAALQSRFSVKRIDGTKGYLEWAGDYDSDSTNLGISLSVEEDQNGIIANLLNLPDAPPLTFNISGAAPVSDFLANVSLTTEGQDRLVGQIKATSRVESAEVEIRRQQLFSVDLSGDLTPLFQDQYRPFFGPASKLTARAVRQHDGRLQIENFLIKTQKLTLDGFIDLQADGLPEAFQLNAGISDPEGNAVLLPISGSDTLVGSADFNAFFRAADSDEWSVQATIRDFGHGDLKIGSGRISGAGQIARIPVATSAENKFVSGRVNFDLKDTSHQIAELSAAMGAELSGTADFSWQEGQPMKIAEIAVKAGSMDMAATGEISGLEDGFTIAGESDLHIGDLSRFAALSGRPLQGAANISVKGNGSVLGGQFDLDLSGNGTDIGVGLPTVDPLISGRSDISMSVRRDESGAVLDRLSFQSAAINLDASGQSRGSDTDATLTVSLDNLGRILAGYSGPASATGSATKSKNMWDIMLDGTGPGDTSAIVSGQISESGNIVVINAKGLAPLGFANSRAGDFSANGTAHFDLSATESLSVENWSGTIASTDASIVFPRIKTALKNTNANVAIDRGVATLNADSIVVDGGKITANGRVNLIAPLSSNVTLRLDNVAVVDPGLFRTEISGSLNIDGPVPSGGTITGQLDLGETEIFLNSSGGPGSTGIPEIQHVNEPARVAATRAWAGLSKVASSGGGTFNLSIDVLIKAARQIFVRGRGLDAELSGELGLTGTTSNVIPTGHFELIRGRIDILGKRLNLSEGILFLKGSFDPTLRLVGETSTRDETIRIIVEGPAEAPEVSFESEPDLPDEEVLARLLFGQGITQISPLQAARLAAAVASLAGEGGGVVDNVREQFGLDDLDITGTQEGGARLSLGKYISENIYTDVAIDSEGNSEISLNLDISGNITARGSVESSGDTGVGIYFEKDY